MPFAYGMNDAAEPRSDQAAPSTSIDEPSFSPPEGAEIGSDDAGDAEPLALTGDFGDAGDETEAKPEATDEPASDDAEAQADDQGDDTTESAEDEQPAQADDDAYTQLTTDLAELAAYRAEKASREQAKQTKEQAANLETPTAASLEQQIKNVDEGVKADIAEWVKLNGLDPDNASDKPLIAAQQKVLQRAAKAEIEVAKLRAEIRDDRARAQQQAQYNTVRTLLDSVASELKVTDQYGTLGNATPSQTKRAEALLTLANSLADTKAAALRAANRPVILDDKAILREAHMTLSKLVGSKPGAKPAPKPIATHAPQNGVKGVAKPKQAPKLSNDEAGFRAVAEALKKARKVAG